MTSFIVNGAQSLSGQINPQGNKNEALPILSAVVLSQEKILVSNLPRILDILYMIDILRSIGVQVQQIKTHTYSFQAKHLDCSQINYELIKKLRGSFTLVVPLLFRFGSLKFPKPGGDKIGRRRIDTHLLALKSLGVSIQVHHDGYFFSLPKTLQAADILLDEASVTATENAIMAACLAKGHSIIHNSASEPHIQKLCLFLNKLGAKISGIATNTLNIQGVEQLGSTQHSISPDYIEVASFIALAAITQSQILIQNPDFSQLRMILMVFEKLGIHVQKQGQNLIVPKNQSLKIASDYHGAMTKIDDSPWPGFPADLTSIALVVATQCSGTVLIFEKMFESRLFFVDYLINMGAKIVLCDPHRAVVIGPSDLFAQPMYSPDIRAGAALLIAALCAKGQSIIQNVVQIDRGYENIDLRLQALGAKIQRVDHFDL